MPTTPSLPTRTEFKKMVKAALVTINPQVKPADIKISYSHCAIAPFASGERGWSAVATVTAPGCVSRRIFPTYVDRLTIH